MSCLKPLNRIPFAFGSALAISFADSFIAFGSFSPTITRVGTSALNRSSGYFKYLNNSPIYPVERAHDKEHEVLLQTLSVSFIEKAKLFNLIFQQLFVFHYHDYIFLLLYYSIILLRFRRYDSNIFHLNLFNLYKHKRGRVISTFIFYKTKDAKDSLHVKNKFSYSASQTFDTSAFQPLQQDYYFHMARVLITDVCVRGNISTI